MTIAKDGDTGRCFATLTLPLDGAADRARLAGRVRASPEADADVFLRVSYGHEVLAFTSADAGGDAVRWTPFVLDAPLPPEADSIRIGLALFGPGPASYTDLTVETLDTRTFPDPSPEAEAYVEGVLDVLEARSIRRDDLDWAALRRRVRAQTRGAESAADAHLAVRYALRLLGDGHSSLVAPDDAAAWRGDGETTTYDGPMPTAERLDGGLSRLVLPGLASGDPAVLVAYADSLRSGIERAGAAGVCGWIVDLRRNGGGNMWPMLAGLGPLLGEGRVGAFAYADRPPAYWMVSPSGAGTDGYEAVRVSGVHWRPLPSLPVAVLTSRRTASSGEAVAVAFRGRPGARSFGEPTRGLSTSNETVALDDGSLMLLTTAAFADRNGGVYGGAITPDETVSTQTSGGDAALSAARRWLRAQQACVPEGP